MNGSTDDPTQQHTLQRVDANAGMLALACGLSVGFRVYMCRQHLANPDKTTVNELFETIQLSGMDIRDIPALQKILRDSEYNGLFWNYNGKNQTVNYANCSYANVGIKLLKRAIATHPQHAELFDQNRPGGRFKPAMVDTPGTIGDYNARLYGGWITVHNDPKITRAKLSAMFNVSRVQLIRWEKRANIEKAYDFHIVNREAYERTDNPPELPEHHYTNRNGDYAYQGANTYSTSMKQSPHYGQSRKIRRAVNSAIDPVLLNGETGQKRYFDTESSRQRYAEKYGERDGVTVFETWQHAHDHYSDTQRRINYHRVHIATTDKNVTHIRRLDTCDASTRDIDNLVSGNVYADTTQPEPVTHHTHERTHATRQPVTVPPATTDNRQSSTRNEYQPVTGNPSELVHATGTRNPSAVVPVHDGNRQSAIDAYEKAQPAIGKIGVYATLRPSRVRITPTGAILWQPDYIPDTLPEHAEVVTCTRGERWLAIPEPSKNHKQSYFASCPDLSDKLLTMALTRHRDYVRGESWQNKKSVLGVSA